jgi:beta-xylosidase
MKSLKRIFIWLILLFLINGVENAGAADLPTHNKHFYMLNKGDNAVLPKGKEYISSDTKIATVKGNKVKAVANGDCEIYAVENGQKSESAHITVGWPLQNPVLPYSWRMYVPDSEVHNFGGKLYVYGSLDASDKFCSPYYISLMTADLRRWNSNGYSFSSLDEGVPFQGRIIWDSDGHFYKGKYFLYGFFEWDPHNENHTFVLESDNPMGPFKNFQWVIGSESKKNIDGISAEIFVDDDGSRYILTAPTTQLVSENYPVIARLAADNVIDESSRKNLSPYIKDFYEAPSMRKRGDTYYFIYAENCGPITDKNHTPKRLSYATSKEIFGEYTYRGPIITVEDIEGNGNIQGSIEQFKGEWYVFYHRAMNGVWNKRSLCVEKIRFDKDGLIQPVSPSSSGIAEGLNTDNEIWFNTTVTGKNYKFSDTGKYGRIRVNGDAEIGFRYIAFTGKEKKLSLQGEGLENITSVNILANDKIIGESTGKEIPLKNVPTGKAELTISVVSTGEMFLETYRFQK